MRYRKVEFNSEGCPSPAIPNVGLLDGRVRIKNRLSADLVGAGIKMTTNIRQNRALQIFILEINGPPDMIAAMVGQVIANRIRVIEVPRRVQIERRIRVGRTFLVSRKRKRALPDPHFGGLQTRTKQDAKKGCYYCESRVQISASFAH